MGRADRQGTGGTDGVHGLDLGGPFVRRSAGCHRGPRGTAGTVGRPRLQATTRVASGGAAGVAGGVYSGWQGSGGGAGFRRCAVLGSGPRPADPGNAICAPVQDLFYVYALRFSPDGRFLCVSDNRYHLKWWDLATGKPLWGQRSGDVALTPDGRGLVTAFGGPYVYYLNAVSGKERFRARITSTAGENLGTVSALAFAPDGAWLAVGQRSGHVSLCGRRPGREVRQFVAVDDHPFLAINRIGYSVGVLAFSPNRRWLATPIGGRGGASLGNGYWRGTAAIGRP